jgi:hypothetical protein
MYQAKAKSIAVAALLASVTALANGCYYYGWEDDRAYYARRDVRYYRYYDRPYDPRYDPYYYPRYDRYYYSRYSLRYPDRYYDDRQAYIQRRNREYYSD